jgi:ribose/xylose/arabinose/galactoside ABC-type transport system permease subunit
MAEDPQASPPEEAATGHHGALDTIADVAMAPVQEAMHASNVWLRYGMAVQLVSALAAGVVAWWLALHDWLVYLLLGLCITVLIGNYQRWPIGAGQLRRAVATVLSLLTAAGWMTLLVDRAFASDWQDTYGQVVKGAALFMVPVTLQLAALSLLVAHAWARTPRSPAPPPTAPAQTPPSSSPSGR